MASSNIDKIIFNEKELFRFLMDFDNITEKYGVEKDTEQYIFYAEHEMAEQLPDVVKRDYSSLYDNIRLVYGNDEKAMRMMYIYKIVKEEVINKFLNIEGLERIYDEHFFEFEWDMHSRLDFDNHTISFYRDHFIHQVRNMYEMWMLINHDKKDTPDDKKIHFYDDIRKWFDYGDNKVSSYVKRAIDKIIDEKIRLGIVCPETELPKLREMSIRYIIKAAIALSALFHDIGYPILHFEGLRKRIAVFMPSLYMFMGGEGNNFEHIYSHLCNSFLFRVVDKEELREAVCDGKNHGAVSAIAFLLTFYQNGVIYNIPPEKKLAIEIAALAIYDHTIKYFCIDDKKDVVAGYYRPIYQTNPIAYLLRICDDMQEWERTYFEIKDTPELIKCPKCGNTFVRQKKDYFEFMPSEHEYRCCCGISTVMCGSDDYVRRKIIDIINCREVKVEFYRANTLIPERFVYIYLDYDSALLLKMCAIAPTFSKYRIKDLSKLKKILMSQQLGGYKEVMVDFLLSPNPFVLKAAIVGKVLEQNTNDTKSAIAKLGNYEFNIEKFDSECKSSLSNTINSLINFNNVLKNLNFKIGFDEHKWEKEWRDILISINTLETILTECDAVIYELDINNSDEGKHITARANSICFYLLLHKISELYRKINSDKYENRGGTYSNLDIKEFNTFLKNKLTEYAKSICDEEYFTDDMEIFIKDAVEQYSRLFDNKNITTDRMNRDEYYKQFKTDSEVYQAVVRYCDSEHALNKSIKTLNFYSDYDLFVRMNNACRLVDRIKKYDKDDIIAGMW